MNTFKISIVKFISGYNPYDTAETLAEAEFATKKEALAKKKQWVKEYGLEKNGSLLSLIIRGKGLYTYEQNF
jgi:hypothetical protein